MTTDEQRPRREKSPPHDPPTRAEYGIRRSEPEPEPYTPADTSLGWYAQTDYLRFLAA
ncbi:hypothetical protein [Catellatospora vulcania]|uniref:hypothetical protein n=1 Tax=Catellatospora vulcania TaxID=1460450 RepID=UPI0012D3BEB0|nr:hypothetical protein [Catellatospora vulcania]